MLASGASPWYCVGHNKEPYRGRFILRRCGFDTIPSACGNWRSRRLHESPTSWAPLLVIVFLHGLAPVATMNTALHWGPIPIPWVTNFLGQGPYSKGLIPPTSSYQICSRRV
jgi:hypothetical protein